jgi:ribosome biogenesis protein Tsr3
MWYIKKVAAKRLITNAIKKKVSNDGILIVTCPLKTEQRVSEKIENANSRQQYRMSACQVLPTWRV